VHIDRNVDHEKHAISEPNMLLITCPWCGERAQVEFSYGGDATVKRPPEPQNVELKEWLDYVYIRDNPRGPHAEWWHHSAGCRQWFQVRRNTMDHKITGSAAPGAKLPELDQTGESS